MFERQPRARTKLNDFIIYPRLLCQRGELAILSNENKTKQRAEKSEETQDYVQQNKTVEL